MQRSSRSLTGGNLAVGTYTSLKGAHSFARARCRLVVSGCELVGVVSRFGGSAFARRKSHDASSGGNASFSRDLRQLTKAAYRDTTPRGP